MSKRGEIQLTPDEQTAYLQAPRKVALGTLDKDGFPHLVAMNYVAKDGAIYMTSYAKAQKVLNIRRNPKVALMVESGDSYAELQGVMMRGHCEIIEDPEQVADIIRTNMSRDGETQPHKNEAVKRAAKRVVLKVTPEKTISWDHTKLGGKY